MDTFIINYSVATMCKSNRCRSMRTILGDRTGKKPGGVGLAVFQHVKNATGGNTLTLITGLERAGNYAGTFSVLGGKLDAHEIICPLSALRREITEETGPFLANLINTITGGWKIGFIPMGQTPVMVIIVPYGFDISTSMITRDLPYNAKHPLEITKVDRLDVDKFARTLKYKQDDNGYFVPDLSRTKTINRYGHHIEISPYLAGVVAKYLKGKIMHFRTFK